MRLAISVVISTGFHLALFQVIDQWITHAIVPKRVNIIAQASLPHSLPAILVQRDNTTAGSQKTEISDIAESNAPATEAKPQPSDDQAMENPPRLVSGGPTMFAYSGLEARQGKLRVELTIDRHGHPIKAVTLESTLPREIEGRIIVEFMRARYEPGMKNGIPIQSIMEIAISLDEE